MTQNQAKNHDMAHPANRQQVEALNPFTNRELQVLALIVRGKQNNEIANILHIVDSTVETHLTTSYRKMNVSNRTEAFWWLYTHDLLDELRANYPCSGNEDF